MQRRTFSWGAKRLFCSSTLRADLDITWQVAQEQMIVGLGSIKPYILCMLCIAVIDGELDEDLSLMEIGPIFHAEWLTLACRVVRFYTSQTHPSPAIVLLAKFCVLVYFPSSLK